MSAPENKPAIRLGGWSFYFLAKLALFWKEWIGFHPLENLAFAAFLLLPVADSRWRRLRTAAAVPMALALLYHDSWLPPIRRALSQASLLSHFSPAYLAELLGRFVNWQAVALLFIVWAGYWIVSRRIRVGVVVVGAMAALLVAPGTSGPLPAAPAAAQPGEAAAVDDLNAALDQFHAREAARYVDFPAPEAGASPFDVIFVHVCSLSWDDLKAVGLENHPLWKRFDITLTRFNSASSYSGPSVLRIQRAACGQTPHDALYAPAASRCYLMGDLRQAGFETNLVLNHDGHFDDFLKLVQAQGGMQTPPMPLAGVAVAQHSFDESPIYSDLGVLSRWLEQRQKSDAPRVAAYYNTISLHDGNQLSGAGAKRSSLDTYKTRLAKLLDDLDAFMGKLEASGRRAVVVMVPEHGAALRGDKLQIEGLREIPSPAITLVPVGVKVIGPGAERQGEAVRVDTPTSYLAVSHIVARMLQQSPYGGFSPADYLADLPATELVSENEGMVAMGRGGRYFLRQDGEWSPYEPGGRP